MAAVASSSSISQESSGRFAFFGLQIMETKRADPRLFLQKPARHGSVTPKVSIAPAVPNKTNSEQKRL